MALATRRFSFIFIKLTFFFSFLSFSALNLIAVHGLATGLHLCALGWTVYVMCLPFSGGGVLFYPLAPIIGYLKSYAWEMLAWIASICLHIYTLTMTPGLYEKLALTHFIYWGITHPIPYWFLFGACFLPTLAAWLHYEHHLPERAFWYYQLRFISILVALVLLTYIALHDIIILSNIHA